MIAWTSSEAPPREESTHARRALFAGKANKRRKSYSARYRMCKQSMEPWRQMDGELTRKPLPSLLGVIAWLNGTAPGPQEKVPLLVPRHFRQFVADEQRAEQRRQSQPLFHQHLWLRERPPP